MKITVQQELETFLLEQVAAGVDIAENIPALQRAATDKVGVPLNPLGFAALCYATARKARRVSGTRGMRDTREGRTA